ncbi:hypothetical protein T265_02575 [Opisthorchis viverrini]|uniref:Uncharacterized protein n=1 Tax=Opisthorchis viverrini TaxID=6198 RepID=A0A075A687_OPIVI|nr:hypothetical protein T265_02575 [Opisthorchis viverrini]KER31125.1 hypothetical protein T265_02575 [Opisthorchis viverrini]
MIRSIFLSSTLQKIGLLRSAKKKRQRWYVDKDNEPMELRRLLAVPSVSCHVEELSRLADQPLKQSFSSGTADGDESSGNRALYALLEKVDNSTNTTELLDVASESFRTYLGLEVLFPKVSTPTGDEFDVPEQDLQGAGPPDQLP